MTNSPTFPPGSIVYYSWEGKLHKGQVIKFCCGPTSSCRIVSGIRIHGDFATFVERLKLRKPCNICLDQL